MVLGAVSSWVYPGLGGAFGPVHEFFHWRFTLLSGGYAKILTWTYTGMDKLRLIPLLAGP